MLDVRGLFVNYGKIQALRGVSLTLGEGEVVAVVGSNGAGKSTLIWTLAGVITPASGRLVFRGRDLPGKASQVARLGIGLVPERRRLFQDLTVRENLLMGAYTRTDEQAKAAMEEVLDLFPPVADKLSVRAGSLSGGEQQMVAIGRALMSQPSLLLMDEPTLGLSPLMADRVMEAILEVNRRGVSVLLVEQNAHRALEVSRRAYVLEGGDVVKEGRSEDLLDDPAVRRAYLGDYA
ncbi:ABC-type branched-chain amino acid transport system, ATPase component [Thermanaerovibrio velox DSM 12556]|jgi:branched-chain amino acid transport system ATP-binding protein|uniref:ABC-type branched-chain amino acid transport system, ATPase component n=1 Tax=Thermanaerovibrio velox DSM 12556 TaxID=926567 RepID=H0UP77_9BACT|nr:ABC transporter ATP-binding protein [Thermanaerovibrio velox]EHM09490.1 ABC-type branched-chain amino acid transport system, ATPase component [Thermanaerovibrio velox DSM 12556]